MERNRLPIIQWIITILLRIWKLIIHCYLLNLVSCLSLLLVQNIWNSFIKLWQLVWICFVQLYFCSWKDSFVFAFVWAERYVRVFVYLRSCDLLLWASLLLASTWICAWVCMCVCVCVFVFVSVCVCEFFSLCECLGVRARLSMCESVCLFVRISICIVDSHEISDDMKVTRI